MFSTLLTNLFAQSSFSGGDLVNQASAMSDSVAQGFNQLWGQVITGGLYAAMCIVGVLFAVATFIFFMVEWTKKMLNGEEQRAFTDFIWVLIVLVLLSNNGRLLGQGTLAVRNYINNTNGFVLRFTAVNANLQTSFQRAVGLEAARSAIGQAIQDCRTSSLLPQEAVTCLQDARDRLSNEYPNYFPANRGPFTWFTERIDRIIQAPSDAINNGANPLQVIFSPFSAVIGSSVIQIVSIILLGLSGAYQWGIELTMMVTALIGPLAVGGSLLPYGSKSIFMWLTGYFSVGMAKLCFNIIVGLAGELIAQSRSDQPLFFLFVIGVIAPFLATGLAAGGGLAVLQQINKAAEMYSSIAIDVGSTLITKGVKKIIK